MKKNNKAFSLIIAMVLVLVSSLLAYTILEYMIPFSKNVSGMENAAKSYYMANSGIEKGLYFFRTREDKFLKRDINSYCTKVGCEDNNAIFKKGNTLTGYSLETISSNNTLPRPGDGDSDYSSDWNTISLGKPLQLAVGYGFLNNIGDLKITFKTPSKEGSSNNLKIGKYISWQLVSSSGSGTTIFSTSNNLISQNDVNKDDINIKNKKGYAFNSSGIRVTKINLKNFFKNTSAEGTSTGRLLSEEDKKNNKVVGANCINPNNECILKFSIIRELETTNGVVLPYLEWKIKTGNGNYFLPLRYSVIETKGKSNGYGKTLKVRYPQKTINQAFDFGVMQ